jgi:hypothetical protein
MGRTLIHSGGNTQWQVSKTKVKRTLASWLYQVLYECRNYFLHGNPVERNDLFLPTPQRTIFEYAAPLYRIALTAFLPLRYETPMPSAKDARASAAYIVDHMDFMRPQESAEEALLTARRPPVDRAARRVRVTRPAP